MSIDGQMAIWDGIVILCDWEIYEISSFSGFAWSTISVPSQLNFRTKPIHFEENSYLVITYNMV